MRRPSWSSSPAPWRSAPSHVLRGPPRSPGSCGSWGCRAHHAGGSHARWLPGRGGGRSRSGPLLIGLGPESRVTSDFGNLFNDIFSSILEIIFCQAFLKQEFTFGNRSPAVRVQPPLVAIRSCEVPQFPMFILCQV